jgi:pimeloyl-ACP methyl ester carboxylesterase
MATQSLYKSAAGAAAVRALYDTMLQSWAVPYETTNVATRYGETFVIASGKIDAPPLVLLHGAGSFSGVWAKDVESYSRTHRVYAVDLVGDAGRSAPIRLDWNSPAFAEWLEDVLNGLKIQKATLVGMSLGGWVATKYAVTNPARVEKLGLICPGGIVPINAKFALRGLFYALTGKWGMKRLVKTLFGDQPVTSDAEQLLITLAQNYRFQRDKLPLFSDDELRRLTMPTLLLGGTKDVMLDSAKSAVRLGQFLPRLQVTLVPGAGHVVSDTAERITEFLQTSAISLSGAN